MPQKVKNAPQSPSVSKLVTVVLLGAFLGSPLYWMSAHAADKPMPMAGKGDAGSMGSMDMHKTMMKGMKDMEGMKPSGNPDHDFAMMMKMHHQMALDMAEVELKQGKDPTMRDMAKKIIEAQKKEIKEFDQWLAKHKQPMADHKSK